MRWSPSILQSVEKKGPSCVARSLSINQLVQVSHGETPGEVLLDNDLCLVVGGLFCLRVILSFFFAEVLLNVNNVACIVLSFDAADNSC